MNAQVRTLVKDKVAVVSFDGDIDFSVLGEMHKAIDEALGSKLPWGNWFGLYTTNCESSWKPLPRRRRTVPIVMITAERMTPYLRRLPIREFMDSGSLRFKPHSSRCLQSPNTPAIISSAVAANTTAKIFRTVGFLVL
jgi:hypothetical protein